MSGGAADMVASHILVRNIIVITRVVFPFLKIRVGA
jgi:hypothetical protein